MTMRDTEESYKVGLQDGQNKDAQKARDWFWDDENYQRYLDGYRHGGRLIEESVARKPDRTPKPEPPAPPDE